MCDFGKLCSALAAIELYVEKEQNTHENNGLFLNTAKSVFCLGVLLYFWFVVVVWCLFFTL